MKSIKNIAITALVTLGAFGAVTFTSCKKEDSGCPAGYEGSDCKTLIADKYINAPWRTTTESCSISGANAAYDITITGSTDASKIIITNLYDASKNTTARITGSNTFTIDEQDFGTSSSITGTGILTDTQLSITYSVSDSDGNTDACNNVIFTQL